MEELVENQHKKGKKNEEESLKNTLEKNVLITKAH